MVNIIELTGRPQVFTLKDGNTFRIFARETRAVDKSNISDEFYIAKSMGFILMEEIPSEVSTKNKKSGGNK